MKKLDIFVFDHFRKSEEDNATQHVEATLVWHVVLWFHGFVGRALDQQVVQTNKGSGHTNFNDKLTALILINRKHESRITKPTWCIRLLCFGLASRPDGAWERCRWLS